MAQSDAPQPVRCVRCKREYLRQTGGGCPQCGSVYAIAAPLLLESPPLDSDSLWSLLEAEDRPSVSRISIIGVVIVGIVVAFGVLIILTVLSCGMVCA